MGFSLYIASFANIKDSNNRTIAKIDGKVIRDSNNRTIKTIDEVKKIISGYSKSKIVALYVLFLM